MACRANIPLIAPESGIRTSSGLLATNLPLPSRCLQLSVAFCMDLLLAPEEHVLWRDVADGAVQADVVVMFHVALYQPPRIIQRQRRSGPNALSFERFMPTFDFA